MALLEHSDVFYKTVVVQVPSLIRFDSHTEMQKYFRSAHTSNILFSFMFNDAEVALFTLEKSHKRAPRSLTVDHVDEVARHEDFIEWILRAFNPTPEVQQETVTNLKTNPMLYGLPYVRDAINLIFGSTHAMQILMGRRAVLFFKHIDSIAFTNQLIKRLLNITPSPKTTSPSRNVGLIAYTKLTLPWITDASLPFTVQVGDAVVHCVPKQLMSNPRKITITLKDRSLNKKWLSRNLDIEMRQQCLSKHFDLQVLSWKPTQPNIFEVLVTSTRSAKVVKVLMTLLANGKHLQYLSPNITPEEVDAGRFDTKAGEVCTAAKLLPEQINAELRTIVNVWHNIEPRKIDIEAVKKIIKDTNMYALLFTDRTTLTLTLRGKFLDDAFE